MRAAVLLGLACFVLAGCGGPTTDTSADEAMSGVAGVPVEPIFQDVTFDVPLGSAGGERWANGTQPFTVCLLTDCNEAAQVTDITDLAPAGVPVRIHVDLHYFVAETDVWGFGVEARIHAPEGSFVEYRSEWVDNMHQTIDALLLPKSTTEVVVAPVWPSNEVQGTDYTVHVSTTLEAERLPPGLPVSTTLAPGETLRFRTLDGGVGTVLVWSGAGGPGRVAEGTFQQDASAPGKQPVILLVPGDGEPVAVQTEGGIRHFGAVASQVTLHEAMEVPAAGSASQAYDLVEAPVAVGVYLDTSNGPAGWTTSAAYTATLTGPDGEEIPVGVGCGAFCIQNGQWYDRTPFGSWPAGTYTVEAMSMGTAGGRVGLVTLQWSMT